MSHSHRQTRSNMDSLRTVEQLAAANHQLASAHNFAIGQLHWLFVELRKNRSLEVAADCQKCRNRVAQAVGTPAGRRRVLARKHQRGVNTARMANKRLRSRNLAASQQQQQSETEEQQHVASDSRTKRLTDELDEQRLMIQRITRDFEDSQQECARIGASLEDALGKLNCSESVNARLLGELEELQRESCDKARSYDEQMSRLTRQLTERDLERQEQILALDNAAQQIRTLELAVEGINQTSRETAEQANDSVDSASSSIEEFKRELVVKREARQRAIAAISSEMDRLRRELEDERAAHSKTAEQLGELQQQQAKEAEKLERTTNDNEQSERVEALRLSDLLKVSDEVTSDLWLQLERTDDLRFQLENEPEEHRLRIGQLRRLAEETRATLRLRRQQIGQLKDRLAQIVVRLGERGFLEDKPEAALDVRCEAERQLEDIARSRQLSDERTRILAELKEHCSKQAHELRVKLEASRKENLGLEEELRRTEDKADAQDSEILNLESQLGLAKADCRDLQNQMSVINSLFSQMLLGASSAEMDLDRLTQLLQENHDLISEMARENSSDTAALPKLLIDIIDQVDGRSRDPDNNDRKEEDELQEENIAHNLPKVWRVLLELLSCHGKGNSASAVSIAEECAPDSCYKSVDTPAGPRLVISVSKTYIRLKELILEKKHLEKEMNRMKQLNTHLESKLSGQEKRLSTVADELSKTWNVVGRMQAQHQQLHTHEKILRYELQQKRKMLQELKKELEYCREKWASARQKNNNTEIEWMSLRREFAARKALITHADSFNTSGESGFSDDREEESDEESETDAGKRSSRLVNSRKRPRKNSRGDDIRVPTPDTESSEQPTDTELSEPRAVCSSSQSDELPARSVETEAQVTKVEAASSLSADSEDKAENTAAARVIPASIDEALSNVICDLIKTDDTANTTTPDYSSSPAVEEASSRNNERKNVVAAETKDEKPSFTATSVFSIGPHTSEAVKTTVCQFSDPLVTESFPKSIAQGLVETPASSTKHSYPVRTEDLAAAAEVPADSSPKEEDEEACCSSSPSAADARAARLQRLEEQAQWLVKKVSDTNRRGLALSSRLEVLHETYGSIPPAPAMPDVLPAFRLQTERRLQSTDDEEEAGGDDATHESNT